MRCLWKKACSWFIFNRSNRSLNIRARKLFRKSIVRKSISNRKSISAVPSEVHLRPCQASMMEVLGFSLKAFSQNIPMFSKCPVLWSWKDRGVFRLQSNIRDGAFLRKWLTTFRCHNWIHPFLQATLL